MNPGKIIHCIKHNCIITDICTQEGCLLNFLCYKCRCEHDQTHLSLIIPIVETINVEMTNSVKSSEAYLGTSWKNFEEQFSNVCDETNSFLKTSFGIIKKISSQINSTENLIESFESSKRRIVSNNNISNIQSHVNSLIAINGFIKENDKISNFLQILNESFRDHLDLFKTNINQLLIGKELEGRLNVDDIEEFEVEKSVVLKNTIYPYAGWYIPQYNFLVIGDSQGNLSICQCINGTVGIYIVVQSAHKSFITNVTYDKYVDTLITGCHEGILKFWRVYKNGEKYAFKLKSKVIVHKNNEIRSIFAIPNKRFILCSGMQQKINLYSIVHSKGRKIIDYETPAETGFNIAFDGDKIFFVASRSGIISGINYLTKKRIYEINVKNANTNWFIDAFIYVPEINSLVAAVSKTEIVLISINSKKGLFVKEKFQLNKGVEKIILGPFGSNKLYCFTTNSFICQLNIKTGKVTDIQTTLQKPTSFFQISSTLWFVGCWKSKNGLLISFKKRN